MQWSKMGIKTQLEPGWCWNGCSPRTFCEGPSFRLSGDWAREGALVLDSLARASDGLWVPSAFTMKALFPALAVVGSMGTA